MPGPTETAATRTRPVFGQLYEHDNTGQTWLPSLIALGGRAEELNLSADPPGALLQPPQFDYAVPPPLDYLEFLIKNPRRLKWPKDVDGNPQAYRPSVQNR